MVSETAYIYKITNIANNKIYIGSTKDIKHRWKSHIGNLSKGKHINIYLQSAWNKYGKDNFIFEIIEECDIKDQLMIEQRWLDSTKCYDREIGYNLSIIAGSPMTGRKLSEETKKKISKSGKGKKRSLETKIKLSEVAKNRKYSEETRTKLSNRVYSEETRKKMSNSSKGKHPSNETREKMSKSHKGKKLSDEHKNNIRESRIRFFEKKKIS